MSKLVIGALPFIRWPKKNPKDMAVGLFFLLAGAFFSIQAWWKYPLGAAREMGPGYFPFWLGVLLAVIGVAKLIEVAAKPGDPRASFSLRVPAFVLVVGAILLFGVALEWLGLVLTVLLMVVISSAASHEFKLRPSVICGVVVSVFCSLLFVLGLGLQLPLWPAFAG